MQGEGFVIYSSGKLATVRICRTSACGHDCGECRLCSSPDTHAEVINTIGAKAGDRVLIGADSGKVLIWAFLLYIMPVLGAFAVYAVSSAITSQIAMQACSVIIYLAVWFVLIRYVSKSKIQKSCILEVLHHEEN